MFALLLAFALTAGLSAFVPHNVAKTAKAANNQWFLKTVETVYSVSGNSFNLYSGYTLIGNEFITAGQMYNVTNSNYNSAPYPLYMTSTNFGNDKIGNLLIKITSGKTTNPAGFIMLSGSKFELIPQFELPPDPVLPSEFYKFVGWFFESAFTNQCLRGFWNGSDTLYPKFEIKQFKISFVTGITGMNMQPIFVEALSTYNPYDPPELSDYTFVGWYTDSSFTTPHNIAAPITSDINLYARWTPKSVTATFMLDGDFFIEVDTKPTATLRSVQQWLSAQTALYARLFYDAALKQEVDYTANMNTNRLFYVTLTEEAPPSITPPPGSSGSNNNSGRLGNWFSNNWVIFVGVGAPLAGIAIVLLIFTSKKK